MPLHLEVLPWTTHVCHCGQNLKDIGSEWLPSQGKPGGSFLAEPGLAFLMGNRNGAPDWTFISHRDFFW